LQIACRATVESVFKSLKAELEWRHNWQTRREVEIALFPSHGLQANHCRAREYINGFYNPSRRHSALGWKSPVAFEQRAV
jgi:transposase InsO family protein